MMKHKSFAEYVLARGIGRRKEFVNMEFKDNLRTKREEFNLSQAELAEKLAVSRQTIIKWEKGENYPDMVNLMSLSRIFGVSIDELAGNHACAEVKDNTEDRAGAMPEDARVSKPTEGRDSKDGIMLILAGLSLILPYGIGLIVAIFVKRTEPAQRNKFVKILSTVSIVVNAVRVILYILMLALW